VSFPGKPNEMSLRREIDGERPRRLRGGGGGNQLRCKAQEKTKMRTVEVQTMLNDGFRKRKNLRKTKPTRSVKGHEEKR